jgi:hypothetical protein
VTALFSSNRDRLVNALRRKSVDLALYSARYDSNDKCKSSISSPRRASPRAKRNDRTPDGISPRDTEGYAMTPLSKYLLGLAAAASVVFSGYQAFSYWMPAGTAARTETPQWKIERLARDPATPMLSAASLSPIYPATPGKELLGKAVIVTARAPQKHQDSSVGKSAEKPVRLALALNKLPRKFFTVSSQNKYSQQRLGYASEPQPRPELINFGHGIY